MRTHVTVDGRVLDLTALDAELSTFYDACVAAYQGGIGFDALMTQANGVANPLVRAQGGWLTAAIWDHPVYQAVRDLADRVGLREGRIRPAPGDDPARDPFADMWITPTEAVAHKGVSPMGLQKAIRRGAVIAHPAKPGGTHRLVSRASLDAWQPDPARQAAARQRATVAD